MFLLEELLEAGASEPWVEGKMVMRTAGSGEQEIVQRGGEEEQWQSQKSLYCIPKNGKEV